MAARCPPSADSVLVIDSCPTNPFEWKDRALQKNCSAYPQTCFKPLEYHCLLNPYGNESLEVCAPNTWLDRHFCPSYNVREQRILEQFDCITLFPRVDCPKNQFFSNTILNHTGCLRQLTGFTTSVGNSTNEIDGTYAIPSTTENLWPLLLLLLIPLLFFLFFFLIKRRERIKKPVDDIYPQIYRCKRERNEESDIDSEAESYIFKSGFFKGISPSPRNEAISRLSDQTSLIIKSGDEGVHNDVPVSGQRENVNQPSTPAGNLQDEAINCRSVTAHVDVHIESNNESVHIATSGQRKHVTLPSTSAEYRGMETLYIKDLFDEWQQEDKFFVSTKASREIESRIKTEKFVIVAGQSGSGKSAIVQHIAVDYRAKGWYVKPVEKVNEIEQSYKNGDFEVENTLFVLHDPFGTDVLDETEYKNWISFEKSLVRFLDLEKVKLFLTCRKCILDQMTIFSRVFDENSIVYIDANDLKLSPSEKREIFETYSQVEIGFCEKTLAEIIEIDKYFPLLCKLYANRKNPEDTKSSLFKEPIVFFSKEIENFRENIKEIYCALACLVFFNNKVCLTDLENGKNQECFKDCLYICDLPDCTKPWQIISSLERLAGNFVKKIGDHYFFYHDLIMEVTTLVLGTNHISKIIKYADIGFIRTRLRLHKDNWSTIVVKDEFFENLSERLYEHLFSERFLEVVPNPCLRNKDFLNRFIEKLGQGENKMPMLIQKTVTISKLTPLRDIQQKNWLSKFDFLNLFEKLSPLFALIVFDQTDLSHYCIKSLREMKEDLSGSNLFAAVCFNGSSNLFDMFSKKDANGVFEEDWGSLYPFQIAILFNCANSLKELIRLGMDVNMRTRDWTPLTFASSNGNTGDVSDEASLVTILLDNGAKINSPTSLGESPIYLACKHGHYSTVKRLCESGAEVNICTNDGESPLYATCKTGDVTLVQYLLQKGAHVNPCVIFGQSPLFVACKSGQEHIVKCLIDNGAEINLCTESCESPLYIACNYGHESVVQILLDKGADINLCTESCESPLYIACKNGHESIVQILLDKGADINLCTESCESPLYIACNYGHESVVHILLDKGADINLCTESCESPLHIACKNGHEIIVQILLDKGADINLCTEYGESPFYAACNRDDDTFEQYLLQKGADKNSCEMFTQSPLFVACKSGQEHIVKCLIDNGAEINLCTESCESPLYIACNYGHESVVQILLDKGADINLCTESCESPLYIACNYGHESVVQILLDKGADINLCTESCESPLYIACKNGHESIVQILLDKGADINLCTESCESPLYIACKNGHESIVQILLDKGADVNLCTESGKSPLYPASKYGSDTIVNILLKQGANVNLCEISGKSPLFVACKNGFEEIVQILLKNGADVNLYKDPVRSPLRAACEKGYINILKQLLPHAVFGPNDKNNLVDLAFENNFEKVGFFLCDTFSNNVDSETFLACQVHVNRGEHVF